MPFQNLVCPAAPLIGHLLLHSSSQHTLIYIVDALRAPRGGFPFSTSGGVDSLQHPFPLFLSLPLTAFRLTFPLPVSQSTRPSSLSLSLCLCHSPPFQLILKPPLCVTSLSLSPFRPCRYSISPVPSSIFDPDLASAVPAATHSNYTLSTTRLFSA